MNNEINNEQILRDFLVYSYFGIVPERIYDKNSFKKLSTKAHLFLGNKTFFSPTNFNFAHIYTTFHLKIKNCFIAVCLVPIVFKAIDSGIGHGV